MTSEILKVKKRFNYPPDLEETPLVNFFNLRNSKQIFIWEMDLLNHICQSLTYNDSKSVKNVTKDFQVWISNSEICKLFEIQFRIHNKYVTKNEKKCWVFLFCKKLRHTIKFLQKIKKRSLVKLWKLRHNF